MIDYREIKKQFPFFKNNSEQIYLDSAATTLKPQVVINAINDYYTNYGTNPHNTDSDLGYKTNVQYELVRQKLQHFINAKKTSEIIFVPGATYGLNQIAYGLSSKITTGDEILITKQEHGANILPWYRLAQEKKAIVKFLPEINFQIDLKQLATVITAKTKIVSFANVPNILGYENDPTSIVAMIKKINPAIIVVIDCAQGVIHMPTDVQKWNADFITFSAHKIFGPTGIGILWGKEELLLQLQPLIVGGGMNAQIDSNSLYYSLKKLPDRLEAGSANIADIFGFGAAIDFVNSLTLTEIIKYNHQLKQYAIQQFNKKLKDKAIIYNADSKGPTLVFNIKNVFCQDVTMHLGSRNNITVRSGDHCARLIGTVILEKNTIRVSFSIYNSYEDIDLLVSALANEKDFLGRLV
ncbi:aminotransferase class V-fold PLP-dependent enzyme [Spiroplasma melliferum]|uniref:Aminotransferase n=2 Tax=Spiroplasma melliferum TaxID=2134 RepID=A0AAI9T3U3_SPIME|nr:aminotransferase class V-fold PLP-dependent enzyme [Spiroplasma melliferum]KAI92819.1 aminotransferase [Spiroplasma melliferum KC3]QCO24455.1 cysteine desulfurase [Spiroplasma melliferum]